jgi:hypothetical protein
LIQFSPLGRCWNWGWFVYLWYFVGTIYIYNIEYIYII